MRQPNFISRGNGGGKIRRSVLRNLFVSMLAFGLIVGLIFPPFARILLDSERALSLLFISMCVLAGLIVGLANFLIFRISVSRELTRVQQGMNHVNQNIKSTETVGEDCENDCQIEVQSADIIGEIAIAFNDMTQVIFERLKLEDETKLLNSNLMHSVELEDVAGTILTRMSMVIQAKGGLLYGGSAEKMELMADFGVDKLDPTFRVLGSQFGPINETLKHGKINVFAHNDGWEWLNQSTPLGSFVPNSVYLIPLLTKQQPVGLVLLACGGNSISDQQLKSLESLRSFAAPYLDNSILHRRITELAALDDLTMILNRRFGLRRLKEEFSRSTRHGIPMSVVMLDIDHFKNFNDTYGHNAGDVVLKMVASKINENLRAEDMACRYGGEEFLIMISGAGMNDAAIISERIRRVIETSEVQWGDNRLSVTISAGLATYPIVKVSVCEELITFADQALYAAKESGRNRVMISREEQNVSLTSLKKANPVGKEE